MLDVIAKRLLEREVIIQNEGFYLNYESNLVLDDKVYSSVKLLENVVNAINSFIFIVTVNNIVNI